MFPWVGVSGKVDNLKTPARAGDVGYDLVNDEYKVIRPMQYMWLPTGVQLQLPDGYWAEIVGRSSTMHKRGLLVIQSIIDTGFRGPLTVGVINLGQEQQIVRPGERIAQILFRQSITPAIMHMENIDAQATERGVQAFGSTGA